MAIQIKIKQALRLIPLCIQSKLVPMLAGSPGIGKSDIARQIAKEHGLKVIDLRLSQCDPTDLLGFPSIKGDKAGYVPMETFPIEGDPLPAGYNGWLLFLDEFNSATTGVQAAAYKLVLDRMVGVHHLHKNVAIMCAGNLDTDGAIVQEQSSALQSRLVHLEMVVDVEDWLEWATSNGIHHHITDYIRFKPKALYTFTADHTDKTYACPRTWEFTNRHMKVLSTSSPDMIPLMSGTLSEGVAREFITFTKIYDDLPKMSQIQSAPDTTRVPDEPSILYALSGSISNYIKPDSAEHLLKYVSRMPVEFQVITLKESVSRNPGMTTVPAVQKWIAKSAATLF